MEELLLQLVPMVVIQALLDEVKKLAVLLYQPIQITEHGWSLRQAASKEAKKDVEERAKGGGHNVISLSDSPSVSFVMMFPKQRRVVTCNGRSHGESF